MGPKEGIRLLDLQCQILSKIQKKFSRKRLGGQKIAFSLDLGGRTLQPLALLLVLMKAWQGRGTGLLSDTLCLILRSNTLIKGFVRYRSASIQTQQACDRNHIFHRAVWMSRILKLDQRPLA